MQFCWQSTGFNHDLVFVIKSGTCIVEYIHKLSPCFFKQTVVNTETSFGLIPKEIDTIGSFKSLPDLSSIAPAAQNKLVCGTLIE